MKTAEQIAQWVIDNRYSKSENNKVSDSEMYHELVESIAKLCTIQRVGNSLDLRELERKLDEALGKETIETLTEWLKQQRQ